MSRAGPRAAMRSYSSTVGWTCRPRRSAFCLARSTSLRVGCTRPSLRSCLRRLLRPISSRALQLKAAALSDSHNELSSNLAPLRRRSLCSVMKRSNWWRAGWAMTGLIGSASGVQSGKSEAECMPTDRRRVCTSGRAVPPWPQRKARSEQPSTRTP
jgi:hypothetical protein